MNSTFMDKQRGLLLKMKEEILNKRHPDDNRQISLDDLKDEGDWAKQSIEQNVSFQLLAREVDRLKRIEQALQKITLGTYGLCLECDEAIGGGRLKTQPFADLCIDHAEEQEKLRYRA